MEWPIYSSAVLPSGAVQILDPKDRGVLLVNNQNLKLVGANDIVPRLIEFINLVDPIYYK